MNQLFWGEILLPLRDRYPVDGFFYTMWDDSNTKLPYHIGLTAYSQMSWSPNRLYLPSANKLRALLSVAGISPDMKSEDELKLFGANHPDWLRDAEVLLVNAERELADFGQQFPLKSLRIQQIEELTNAVEQAKIIMH
ncbi:hypothetical protein SDC9_118513 [bioreactor metagenome]|uniref:Uncharacterized protein n=1 Tax=bioreactor metagenome TaxID=1076179 RepID=A0A645C2V3_9ZZZZ